MDVVELEAEVVEASKDVGFQRDPRISITVQDGAIFAQDAITLHADAAYDAVIIDAYDADGNVPETFSSDGPFLEVGIWTIWCAPLLTDVVFKKNMHWNCIGHLEVNSFFHWIFFPCRISTFHQHFIHSWNLEMDPCRRRFLKPNTHFQVPG